MDITAMINQLMEEDPHVPNELYENFARVAHQVGGAGGTAELEARTQEGRRSRGRTLAS